MRYHKTPLIYIKVNRRCFKLNSNEYTYVIKGVIRGFLLTLMLILIYAIVMSYKEIPENISSILFLAFSMVSIMFGAIYSTKKIQKKGWLVGILVAFFYMILLYLVSIIAGQSAALTLKSLFKLIAALFIGLLSGMLGINI